jgi:hypothetical protein
MKTRVGSYSDKKTKSIDAIVDRNFLSESILLEVTLSNNKYSAFSKSFSIKDHLQPKLSLEATVKGSFFYVKD